VIVQSNATIGIGVAPVSFVWPPAHRASRFLDPRWRADASLNGCAGLPERALNVFQLLPVSAHVGDEPLLEWSSNLFGP